MFIHYLMSIYYVPGRGLQRSLRHKTLSLVSEPDKQPTTIQCRKNNGGNVHRSCWCARRTWSRLWHQEEGERFTLRWTQCGGLQKKKGGGREGKETNFWSLNDKKPKQNPTIFWRWWYITGNVTYEIYSDQFSNTNSFGWGEHNLC